MMTKLILKLIHWLTGFILEDRINLVTHLIIHTAGLGLMRDDWVEFSPMPNVLGPMRLYWNTCPIFQYRVFEKSLMEFILVRVAVAKPDKILFNCTIDSIGTLDPSKHGKEVEWKDSYTKPFWMLCHHLIRYFPYVMTSEDWEKHRRRTESPHAQGSPRPSETSQKTLSH